MSTLAVANRDLVYCLTEASAGTPEDITQSGSPDAPLRIESQTWTVRGGPNPQDQASGAYAATRKSRNAKMGWDIQTVCEIREWGATPDPSAVANSPINTLLTSCCGNLAANSTPDYIRFTPRSGFTVGTTVKPVTMHWLQNGGNYVRGKYGVSMLERIAPDGDKLLATFRTHAQFLDGAGDTVQDLDGATPTIAGGFDDYVDEDPIEPRGATLTITGLSGTEAIELHTWEFLPGMSLDEREVQTATRGYGPSHSYYSERPQLVVTVPWAEEVATGAGRTWWQDAISLTELTTVSVVYGSGDGRFEVSMPAAQLGVPTITEAAGHRALQVPIFGLASSGDDQFTLQWGASA